MVAVYMYVKLACSTVSVLIILQALGVTIFFI